MGLTPPFSLVDANGFFAYPDGSNIQQGTNPSYAVSDFLAFYPQFASSPNQSIIQTFISMANASLQQTRWQTGWQFAMSLYVAHFCTLYLQTLTYAPTAVAVFEAGKAQGVITSESAGDVSYSSDANIASVPGWAAWNLTVYGQQLATIGKLMGKGGMFVY